MAKNKGKPKISKQPQSLIVPSPQENENKKLVISFEYLCTDNNKYSMDDIGNNRDMIQYYKDFYQRINEYSQFENFKKEINENRKYRDRNHIHPINWKDPQIRESCFTSLNTALMEQIKDECWQLGINNHSFRIHGFFIENIFYVVWLDPLHKLYKRK